MFNPSRRLLSLLLFPIAVAGVALASDTASAQATFTPLRGGSGEAQPGDDRGGAGGGGGGGAAQPGDDRGGAQPGDDRGGAQPGDDRGGAQPGDDRDGAQPGDDRGGAQPGDDRSGATTGHGADDMAGHDAGELTGAIEALPASGLRGLWRVGGRDVTVVDATRIEQEDGAVVVGATVEVHGAPDANGALIASTIEVKSSAVPGAPGVAGARIEILGTIGALPAAGPVGVWTVGDRPVTVTAQTVLEFEHAMFAVGVTVEVKAVRQDDGSLLALRIETKAGEGAPVPAAHFWGRVSALPTSGMTGIWRIDDKLVDVSATTQIELRHGPVALQAIVEVEGWVQADGVIVAKSLETEDTMGAMRGQGTDAVEFHHARLNRFFISASQAEIEALDRGGEWQRTGEHFKVGGGTQAACRFYGMPPRGPDSHFFTIDAAECAKVMGDMPAWTFEGFAFSVTPPKASGECPAGLVPVHRLYNQATRAEDMNHRYVASASAVAATVASGWVDEGVVMCSQP